MRIRTAILVCSITALMVPLGTAAPASATGSGTNGRIAFCRSGEIFSIKPDGTELRRLARRTDQSFNCLPAWSPDGDKIVYRHDVSSGTKSRWALFIMNPNGSHKRRITSYKERRLFGGEGVWSPNGRRIAFEALRETEPPPPEAPDLVGSIKKVRRNGTNERALTGGRSFNGSPTWSPGGHRIAFISYRDGDADVFVMDADGTHETNLTSNEEQEPDAAWSPVTHEILFERSKNVPGPDGRPVTVGGVLYLVDADGTGETAITDESKVHEFISWSPDGSHISFLGFVCTVDGCGRPDLYVIKANGSSEANLTAGRRAPDFVAPAWSPDGRKIAYVAHGDIFVTRRDGTNIRRLTKSRDFESVLSWRPIVSPSLNA